MPRRRWLTPIAVCLLVSPIAFAVGHWSKSTPSRPSAREQSPPAEPLGKDKPIRPVEMADYSNVTIENLGQVEFGQAFALLDSAPREALTAWAKRLEGLPVGPRRTAGLTAFFKTLAQLDAKTAVDLAVSLERYEPRWTAIGAIGSATPAANFNEVARMYTLLNEPKLGLGDFVTNWSRSDPAATAQFLSNYAGDVRNSDVAELMTNWAALDPAAAEKWLADQQPARRDADVYAGFYSGWLEHDRAAALNELKTRLDDETFNKALEVVGKDLFKDSQEATRAFISTLSPAAQETAVQAITGDVTAVYLRGSPDLQADEVAKWLVTLPEHLWRGQMGEVLNRWLDQDRAARDAWIDQLPRSTRDAVLAEYCKAFNSYLHTDLVRAGLRISDPGLRRETFRNIFSDMEEEAREQIVADAQLVPAETVELAKILKQP